MQERRKMGQRRWGLSNEFPLLNHEGTLILSERRTLPDRRRVNTSLEERLLMLTEMPLPDSES